jgi:PAS domain S-box-containing protein
MDETAKRPEPRRDGRARDHDSEHRYRELFEVASDWFWETDPEGRVTFISPNVEAALGVSPASYLGKRLVDAEDVVIERESAKTAFAAMRAREPYRDLVYLRQLPSGRRVWVNSSGAPFYDAEGTFLGYRGIARDVTTQIEAERALQQSEQRFRQLFEAMSDYYWENDAQARMTHVSGRYEEIMGLSLAEGLGKRLGELPGVSVDPEMAKMAFLAMKNHQPLRDFVFSRKLASGETRWFKTSAVPVFDESGAYQGARGVTADITKNVLAEKAAQLAQNRLHDAVAYVTQPFVFYDAAGSVVAYNQAFTDLHRNAEASREMFDRLERDTNDRADQILLRALAAGQPVSVGVSFAQLAEWQIKVGFFASEDQTVTMDVLLRGYQSEQEQTFHLSDGRWMLVIYRPLPGGGRVGLWSDVTALKRAEAQRRMLEQQLHHLQRLEALGTLAGGVAHEINNALVPVIALTKIAAGKLLEDSRERRNLQTVLAGAERSRDLVRQILAFSRKEEPLAQPEKVDLAGVLQGSLKLLRATVPTSIALLHDISHAVPAVSADAKELEQVIVNLVTNAAQAIGDGNGTITVRLRGEANRVHLSIADTGCGMDAATKARIFEPFFTTKAVGSGTGLGLAVVHGIIKKHGGSIAVESAPGQGTRFDIVLPALSASTNEAA